MPTRLAMKANVARLAIDRCAIVFAFAFIIAIIIAS